MMAKLPLLFSVVGSGGVLLTGALLYWMLRWRRAAAFDALRRRLGGIPLNPSALAPPAGRVETVPGALGAFLDGLLIRAGDERTATALLTQIGVFGAVGLVGGVALSRSTLGLAGVALGAVPILLLRNAAAKRDLLLSTQLPDALDLIGRAMRAGHALSDSLRISASEMPSPIGIEFTRVSEENRMGRGLREALTDLTARNPDNFDLRLFMSVVMLQRETGGNLVEILENLARTIRERSVFQEKVKALTAEVRMSARVLLAMPILVGTLLVLMQPTYLYPLLHTSLGQHLLLAAGSSLVLSTRLMNAITRISS